jgi:GntR family transcriptional regulator
VILADLPARDDRPLHHQVADAIRRAMDEGALHPGDRVPGENVLMTRYGIARWTAREALAALAAEGRITKEPGRGTFVRRARSSARRAGMERYARSRWLNVATQGIVDAEATSQGKQASRTLRELAQIPAPQVVAERLEVDAGAPVWVRRRSVALEGRVNQLADSYYPLDVARGTSLMEQETGPGGDFACLHSAGHSPSRVREEWSTRMPRQDETEILDLASGTPVVGLTRTLFDQDGRAVEVMISTIAGDSAAFVYDFVVDD